MTGLLAYFAARSLPGGPSVADDGRPAPELRPRLPSRYETLPLERQDNAGDFVIENDAAETAPARRSTPAAPDAAGPVAPPAPGRRDERPAALPPHVPGPPALVRSAAQPPAQPSHRLPSVEPQAHTRAASPAPDGTAQPTAFPAPRARPPDAAADTTPPRPVRSEASADQPPPTQPRNESAVQTLRAAPQPERTQSAAAPPPSVVLVPQRMPPPPPPPPPAPLPVPAPRARDAAAPQAAAPPRVQVTIGRLEIRAASQPAPEKRSPPPAPSMSLGDYLARRGSG